jgi:hypothetical protein
MIKTYSVIRKRDYGFFVPPEAHISDDYIYYRIKLIEPLKAHPPYEDMYRIFRKLLPLAEHGLAWIDYKPSNIGIVNGNYVIIDFECVDQYDIEDTINTILCRLKLDPKPENIKRWIKTTAAEYMALNPYYLIILFALIHGHTDPLNVMRLAFNYCLFRRRNDITHTPYNGEIYKFMIETPFALL